MDPDSAHLEQQLLRFEEELYTIQQPRTPILLRNMVLQRISKNLINVKMYAFFKSQILKAA